MFKNCCGCKHNAGKKHKVASDGDEAYKPELGTKADVGRPEKISEKVIVPEKVSEKAIVPEKVSEKVVLPDKVSVKTVLPEKASEKTVLPDNVVDNIQEKLLVKVVPPEKVDENIQEKVVVKGTAPEKNPEKVVPEKLSEPEAVKQKQVPEPPEVLPNLDLPPPPRSEDLKTPSVGSPDAATLRELAHGFLATPHPSKRSDSVPGLGSLPQWLSQEDDDVFGEGGGTTEPPATPVGRDELALRRHRFFSDLLHAHQAGSEHRVRFDPLGPTVAGGCDLEIERCAPSVELESLLNRLEKVTTRLEQTAVATEHILSQTEPPPIKFLISVTDMSVVAFEKIVQGPLASFIALSLQIGGDVASISQHVSQAFQAQLQYLSVASQSKAPESQHSVMSLLQPTSTQISSIQDYREKHRGSPHFNHLSAISESIAALGWVTVSPAPAPYVKEMNDAGQFYTNRVLKEWKEKDKTHKAWVDAWVETLSELHRFVKQHHTTGLVWGGKSSAGGGRAPPPPPGMPPPPPVLPIGDEAPCLDGSAQDRSALFAEINKGEGITSTLKRVTPDMQTHKNTTLRSGPAPFRAPAQSVAVHPVASSQPVNKPPVFTRDGKKWLVEYQKGNNSLVIDNAEMNNVVYMYKCQDSTLTVKGKLNSVVLDSCRKSSVVFESLVSSIEFVNCQSVQMQVLKKVPTISIDKTDGCQMYLSPESLNVEIVSSKSSEMNVMVPKGNGDFGEFPVPEQFKTTVSSKGLQTVAIENKG